MDSGPNAENLLCEYARNPIAIDVLSPRLSWAMEHGERDQTQTAYQILVSRDLPNLSADRGEMWNSGQVPSAQSVNVVYAGAPLESGQTYYWKVRVWDNQGRVSPYSQPATFEMGLLESDDWKSGWYGCDGGMLGGGFLFRRNYDLPKEIKRARVYISGLGYYELRINGQKVGDHVLDPAWTEYSKTVLYVTYDVTSLLKKGENAVGVMLGNGWFGKPRLLFQLNVEYADGTSEAFGHKGWELQWMVARSPVRNNSIYDGETYDARLEQPGWDSPDFQADPFEWNLAQCVEEPGGELKAQMLEPIKVVETLQPIALTNPKPGVYVYDLGQNIAGWARLTVQGPRDTAVTLKFAETLYPDGTVNQENLRTVKATNTYILKGEGQEVYEPRFTYFGFRYVQVTGFPGTPKFEDIQGRVVRSSVEKIGAFTCSNELVNQIQRNIVWTEANNLHGLPTDCPQRDERMAWLNDMTVRAEEAIYNFDMVRLYTKWLRDIRDAQDKETGAVPDTAPYRWGSLPGDPVDCYTFLTWFMYLYYGDKRILEQHYEGLKQWVDFLGTQADDHIVTYTRFGDWCTPITDCYPAGTEEVAPEDRGSYAWVGAYPSITPGILISTAYFYYNCITLVCIAETLGETQDAQLYAGQAELIKAAFNQRFFDTAEAQYATGSQGCNALPLFLSLVPGDKQDALLENIVDDITEKHEGHLNTGNQCTKYMFEALTQLGRGDVAYTMLTQTTYPGWGYMIERGATTIWERWEEMTGKAMNSHDHPMLGSIGAWFYSYLAGLQPDPDRPGWEHIHIRPYPVGDLSYVEASLETPRGLTSSKWQRNSTSFKLEITVPANSQAEVSLPTLGWASVSVTEGRQTIWDGESFVTGIPGIHAAHREEGYVSFQVGSGSYEFEIQNEGA